MSNEPRRWTLDGATYHRRSDGESGSTSVREDRACEADVQAVAGWLIRALDYDDQDADAGHILATIFKPETAGDEA